MNSFDEIDSIFNDVVEDITTQEVEVESEKTWMFWLSLSDSYHHSTNPYDGV